MECFFTILIASAHHCAVIKCRTVRIAFFFSITIYQDNFLSALQVGRIFYVWNLWEFFSQFQKRFAM